MNESHPVSAAEMPKPVVVAWMIRFLAGTAAAVAGYLMTISLQNRGLPAGCGAGSGCAVVLVSKWSNILGLPVSVPAFAVYLGILVASFWITSNSTTTRQSGWRALLVLTALAAGAALWFITVQIWILESICPWCMIDHTLGLLTAGTVYAAAPRNKRPQRSDSPSIPSSAPDLPSRTSAIAMGVVGMVLFVGLQYTTGRPTDAISRLPAGQNTDTGPGEDRVVSVLQGQLQLRISDEPIIGSPNAPHLVLMLFDYACPHCRRTHGYFFEIMQEHPNEMAIVALPMPLDGDCNPTVDVTKKRFENSCDLARFALAVWLTKPQSFAEFDRWLFEPSKPRERLEAKNRAREIIGREQFNATLEDPSIKRRIDRNILAYIDAKAQRIPVIVAPGFNSIIGAPESKEQLWEILQTELLGKKQKKGVRNLFSRDEKGS